MKKSQLLLMAILFLSIIAKAQPYQIGHKTQYFYDPDRSNREIWTEIYYPADVAGDNVDLTTGEFPVIVFGHGFVMTWDSYANFWEEFVPKGYIMVFPRTEGGMSPSHEAFGLDLAFLADAMQDENINSSSIFFGKVGTKTAVMGHSMGGGSSFIAAQANSNINTIVTFAAAETTPSAIAAAADIYIPSIVFSGSVDGIAPADENQIPMYNALSSYCKNFISVTGCNHCYFADYNFNCSMFDASATLTRDQIHAIVFSFLTPWFEYTLGSDDEAIDDFNALLPTTTDITYQQSCDLSACNPPLGLNASNITSSSADISWNPAGSETLWNIELGTPGFTPGTGAAITTYNSISSNPYSVAGLSASTTYEFYVQADCGGELSYWAGPYQFSSSCGMITAFPWTEDFEGSFLPNCWSKVLPGGSSPNDITQSSSQNHTPSGTYSARFSSISSSSNYNQYLFTPQFTIDEDFTVLSFWHRKYNSSAEVLEWGISTTNNPNDFTWTAVSLSGTTWQETVVDLSAYVGQNVYIGFHYYGNFYYSVYLDDVSITAPPPVPSVNWSSLNFSEAAANDGSIGNTIDITLEVETFATTGILTQSTHYNAANLPAGLGIEINVTSSSQATISLTGNAIAHEDANDVSNLEITFLDAAFTGGSASSLIDYSQTAINIDFMDEVLLTTDLSIIYPQIQNYSCYFDGTDTISIGIQNIGETIISSGSSIDIFYQIESFPVNTETRTLTSVLDIGANIFFEFDSQVDLSGYGSYDLNVWFEFAEDEITANNTITGTIVSYELNVDLGGTNDTISVASYPFTLNAGTFPFAPEYLWWDFSTNQTLTVTEDGWYGVLVNDEFGCWDEDSVYVEMEVGTEEIDNKIVAEIFPNPTSGVFSLNISEDFAEIIIFDNCGRKILEQNIIQAQKENSFDLSILSEGIYYLKIVSRNSIITKKLIIQK
ncbi:MAG: choice-of-anchor J domain-containing protein [Bacteroidales bacterium]|nr:choice-of-anchor J domain-containing protein [Bacteroidales bacterium]